MALWVLPSLLNRSGGEQPPGLEDSQAIHGEVHVEKN